MHRSKVTISPAAGNRKIGKCAVLTEKRANMNDERANMKQVWVGVIKIS